MRVMVAASLAFALAGCGASGGGDELAAGNSDVSSAQIDAALGPANQSSVEDAIVAEEAQNEVATGNEATTVAESPGANVTN